MSQEENSVWVSTIPYKQISQLQGEQEFLSEISLLPPNNLHIYIAIRFKTSRAGKPRRQRKRGVKRTDS